jgi:chromosome segregation ATPase
VQDEVDELRQSLAAAEGNANRPQAELATLRAAHSGLQASLVGRQTAAATLEAQVSEVRLPPGALAGAAATWEGDDARAGRWVKAAGQVLRAQIATDAATPRNREQGKDELADLRAQVAALAAERAALQSELQAAQSRAEALESEASAAASQLEEARQTIAADAERHVEEICAFEEQLESEQAARAAAAAEAAAARRECEQALARAEAAEAAAAQGGAEAAERAAALEAAGTAEAEARAASEALQVRLDEAEAALGEAKAEGSSQAMRLRRVEAQLEALQEALGQVRTAWVFAAVSTAGAGLE